MARWPVTGPRVGIHDRHDWLRKAEPVGSDDGPAKIARIEAALPYAQGRDRTLLLAELTRLTDATGH